MYINNNDKRWTLWKALASVHNLAAFALRFTARCLPCMGGGIISYNVIYSKPSLVCTVKYLHSVIPFVLMLNYILKFQ